MSGEGEEHLVERRLAQGDVLDLGSDGIECADCSSESVAGTAAPSFSRSARATHSCGSVSWSVFVRPVISAK